MNNNVQSIIKKTKELNEVYKIIKNKDKVVEYLVNEKKLPKEEI